MKREPNRDDSHASPHASAPGETTSIQPCGAAPERVGEPRNDAGPEAHETTTQGAPRRVVLSESDIDRALRRLAFEILESNKGPEGLVLMGIPSRGYPLAQRLAANIVKVHPELAAADLLGQVDITLYRDDLRSQPTRIPGRTEEPAGGIEGKTVVLVDDVLYSGRSVRAALDALGELGRPKAVRLAVLVDRGHRQLPIRADHVGKNLPTAASERVRVRVAEIDGVDSVSIEGGK